WQGCKCPDRLAVLVLIGTLAHTLLIFIGLSGVSAGLHRQFQANTTRHRTVLSYAYLALRMVGRKIEQIRRRDWLIGIHEFRQIRASYGDDLHAQIRGDPSGLDPVGFSGFSNKTVPQNPSIILPDTRTGHHWLLVFKSHLYLHFFL